MPYKYKVTYEDGTQHLVTLDKPIPPGKEGINVIQQSLDEHFSSPVLSTPTEIKPSEISQPRMGGNESVGGFIRGSLPYVGAGIATLAAPESIPIAAGYAALGGSTGEAGGQILQRLGVLPGKPPQTSLEAAKNIGEMGAVTGATELGTRALMKPISEFIGKGLEEGGKVVNIPFVKGQAERGIRAYAGQIPETLAKLPTEITPEEVPAIAEQQARGELASGERAKLEQAGNTGQQIAQSQIDTAAKNKFMLESQKLSAGRAEKSLVGQFGQAPVTTKPEEMEGTKIIKDFFKGRKINYSDLSNTQKDIFKKSGVTESDIQNATDNFQNIAQQMRDQGFSEDQVNEQLGIKPGRMSSEFQTAKLGPFKQMKNALLDLKNAKTYSDLKAIRSAIGDEAHFESDTPTTIQKMYRIIYYSIGNDMQNVADKQGFGELHKGIDKFFSETQKLSRDPEFLKTIEPPDLVSKLSGKPKFQNLLSSDQSQAVLDTIAKSEDQNQVKKIMSSFSPDTRGIIKRGILEKWFTNAKDISKPGSPLDLSIIASQIPLSDPVVRSIFGQDAGSILALRDLSGQVSGVKDVGYLPIYPNNPTLSGRYIPRFWNILKERYNMSENVRDVLSKYLSSEETNKAYSKILPTHIEAKSFAPYIRKAGETAAELEFAPRVRNKIFKNSKNEPETGVGVIERANDLSKMLRGLK